MKLNKQRYSIIFFFLLAGILLLLDFGDEKSEALAPTFIKNAGLIHGTMYHITYEHPKGTDLQKEIEEEMHDFDGSLSTYQATSIISRINQNQTDVETDPHFEKVFTTAYEVSSNTNGAFDLTVAPLVNLWGFGFDPSDPNTLPRQEEIDSILSFIGYKNIRLVNHRVIKTDPRIMLDANAIAKGYSVDIVARFLEAHSVENYMVEIGGEIVVKGHNPKGQKWRVGVDKPVEDPSALNRKIQKVVALENNALATSGNYRQFYEKDGKKYSHTINPKTGYPVHHNLLSATVIGPDCMTADAYATACMVMGVEKSLSLADDLDEIEVYLLYADDQGKLTEVYSEGFDRYFE